MSESIIGTTWSHPSADVPGDIRAINEQAQKLLGYRPPTEYEIQLMERADQALERLFAEHERKRKLDNGGC